MCHKTKPNQTKPNQTMKSWNCVQIKNELLEIIIAYNLLHYIRQMLFMDIMCYFLISYVVKV